MPANRRRLMWLVHIRHNVKPLHEKLARISPGEVQRFAVLALESYIRKAVLFSLAALAFVQLVLLPLLPEGALNPVPGLEGRPLQLEVGARGAEPLASGYRVVIQLQERKNAPKAVVLVNGQPRGSFSDESVTAYLKMGDLLEVDARRYKKLKLVVTEAPAWAAELRQGSCVEGSGEIILIGRLR